MENNIRCEKCKWVLMKKAVTVVAEIKCHKCGHINKLNHITQTGIAQAIDNRAPTSKLK